MRIRYYLIVALLVSAHLLTELHTVVYWLNPSTSNMLVEDLFIKPKFKVEGLNILWYLKMIEDTIMMTAILLAGACQAYSRMYITYLEWQRYAFRIYIVWCIFFIYHCFDLVQFLYSFKTGYLAYMIALGLVTGLTLFVAFFRHKRSP